MIEKKGNLYFQNCTGEKRIIAPNINENEAIKVMKQFCKVRSFEIPYIRSWDTSNGRTYDVGSHTEFFLWVPEEIIETKYDAPIKELQDILTAFFVSNNIHNAIQLGIKSLEDLKEREKGCSYCHYGDSLEFGPNHPDPDIYIKDNILFARRYDERDSEIEINFCPKCGRKLI